MISYTVEVVVPTMLVDEWLTYMLNEHVVDVLATGCFVDALIEHVIEPSDPNATVFRVRYLLESEEKLATYRETSAPALQAHHTERFGTAIQATRSVAVIVQSEWPRKTR